MTNKPKEFRKDTPEDAQQFNEELELFKQNVKSLVSTLSPDKRDNGIFVLFEHKHDISVMGFNMSDAALCHHLGAFIAHAFGERGKRDILAGYAQAKSAAAFNDPHTEETVQ